MVIQKSTQIRVVGKITDKVHPLRYFQVSMKQFKGCTLFIFPTNLVCVLFCTTIPILTSSIFNYGASLEIFHRKGAPCLLFSLLPLSVCFFVLPSLLTSSIFNYFLYLYMLAHPLSEPKVRCTAPLSQDYSAIIILFKLGIFTQDTFNNMVKTSVSKVLDYTVWTISCKCSFLFSLWLSWIV